MWTYMHIYPFRSYIQQYKFVRMMSLMWRVSWYTVVIEMVSNLDTVEDFYRFNAFIYGFIHYPGPADYLFSQIVF